MLPGRGHGVPSCFQEHRTMSDESSVTSAVNVTYFDAAAREYDSKFGLSLEGSRARARFLRSHSRRPMRVGRALDLGCGTGHLAAALLLEGIASESVGLDISSGMVGVATESYGELATFLVGDAGHLPFADASFDLVVGDAFLHHVLDVSECLAEVKRVLRPGGVATFNEPWRNGYSFVEVLIRVAIGNHRDQHIDTYLRYLQCLRENAGDLDALERCPYPDKHFFTHEHVEVMAKEAGFVETCIVPALDYYPDCWANTLNGITASTGGRDDTKERLADAGAWVDELIGQPALEVFCPHVQIFLYT